MNLRMKTLRHKALSFEKRDSLNIGQKLGRPDRDFLACRLSWIVILLIFTGLWTRSTAAQQNASAERNESPALSAQQAVAILKSHQHIQGYWLTPYTSGLRFKHPGIEMNIFLTAMMIDVLDPVAKEASLDESLQRARQYLADQIEAGGLVRYHGRPDAPTIHTLGCIITPDADDTALVWRIAPGAHPELLQTALKTLNQYRTSEGLYRTWLAPSDDYRCIDPGKDPNPADIGIQMHVLMLLAESNPSAGQSLCNTLRPVITEDRIWVYYKVAPLIPILRQADLQKAGCSLKLPVSRLRSDVPGQEIWIDATMMLQRMSGIGGSVPSSAEVLDLLQKLSRDDFAAVRQSPPLLYHNDFTGSTPRFYWSWDFGYALWLRLYFENARNHPVRISGKDKHAAWNLK